jgi:hypothetical protein
MAALVPSTEAVMDALAKKGFIGWEDADVGRDIEREGEYFYTPSFAKQHILNEASRTLKDLVSI